MLLVRIRCIPLNDQADVAQPRPRARVSRTRRARHPQHDRDDPPRTRGGRATRGIVRARTVASRADSRRACRTATTSVAIALVVELADTSAWVASARDPVLRERVDNPVAAGEIATCDPVKLELLHGARNAEEFSSVRTRLDML